MVLDTTVSDELWQDAVELLRGLDEDFESVRYVYLSDEDNKLSGVVTLNALIVAEPETPLADICTREVITASPEDDQEDVAEDIAKYNLLAMPVVADDGHLLGIVTVDDALDVLEEEHAEDLQIAGGIASDDESAHGGDLLWLLRRNAWFFIWMVGVGLFVTLSYLTPAFQAPLSEMLLVCSALPIALVLADDSVSYVTNFFLENDPDDEDSPSMLGFTIKSLALGIAFAALVVLVEMALDSVLVAAVHAPADLSGQLRASFAAAAIAVLVAFVLCPVWLLVLRKRDEKNQDTSGFALSVIAMIVALVVFCLAMGQLANALGILGVFA